MTDDKRSARSNGHLVVLVVALAVAVLIWYLWLTWAMYWAQGRVLEHLTTFEPSTVQANPDEPAVSGPPTMERERLFAEIGQTGDSFGALNALLTAIAGGLVLWAGVMQYESLKQAQQEARDERAYRRLQEFESLFFQLLGLSAAVTERIEATVRPAGAQADPSNFVRRHVGSRALDSFAHRLYRSGLAPSPNESADMALRNLVHEFTSNVYDKSPSTFGPYFRLLYQTFKHIAESSLSEQEQIRYANIARGQISEGAVLLLALNGLARYGHKFIPLIEKFGLLEHLHPRYRHRYGDILRVGYRPRAFMGSANRAVVGNEWIKDPLLPENHFAD